MLALGAEHKVTKATLEEQPHMTICYAISRPLFPDATVALKYLLEAAELGSREAHECLALLYEHGASGVPIDSVESLKW